MRRLFVGMVAMLSLAVVSLVAQNAGPASKSKPYTPPKTPWGDPDLQGQWPAYANIPMQRPLSAAEKATLSPEELAKREEQFRRQADADNEEFAGGNATTTIKPPRYWG